MSRNDAALDPIAVANEETLREELEAEKYEAVLTARMIGIVDKKRVVVDKDRGGLGKGDAMPALVEPSFVVSHSKRRV